DGQGVRDAMGEEWTDCVRAFLAYMRASYEVFPAPATEHKDALLRVLSRVGASPRDLFRLYVATVREMMHDNLDDESAVRPILFLTHILACLVEEQQVMLSLNELAAQPRAEQRPRY